MAAGPPPPAVPALLRAQDRMTFIYVEHARIHRESNAITATDARGTVHIPAATLGTLLLGPGTRVSHQAMMLIAQSGSTAVWVGENAVRYYAHGRTTSRSSRFLEAQARLVSSTRSRLAVAREMYAMRFPGEDVSGLTMQQLRGREGARVKRVYAAESKRSGVQWKRRDYRPDDFESSDPINQALSAAHSAMYGLVHAAVVSVGCSPGLGFVHTGHDLSFVYDVADLYKAELSIPVAFDVAAQDPPDVGAATRHAMRDAFHSAGLVERVVKDLRHLLLDDAADEEPDGDVVMLWDAARGVVGGGTNYDTDVDW